MLPGWRREGTMKSRAPSGVDLMSIGVSISTKPAAWWAARMASTRRLRVSRRAEEGSRRRSR